MAANQIVGVAILDRARSTLHVACEYPNGSIHVSSIQAVPEGDPDARPGPCWHYKIIPGKPGRLAVSPSLLIRSTRPSADGKSNEEFELFHNSGQWEVEFADYESVSYLCHLINKGLYKPAS